MRSIKELRVYCECYEQGLYLLDYISDNDVLRDVHHKIIYTKPNNFPAYRNDSIISKLFSHKDFDGFISIIEEDDTEHPIVAIEFSTAVPTDDHIMQRYDVMYWSTYYQTPCIKISPSEMNNTDFGGGKKIKIQHEYYTTLNMGGIYYHIDWPLIENSDLVMTDITKISCPPFLNELKEIMNGMIESYNKTASDNEYFEAEKNKYSNYVHSNYNYERLEFTNSSRIRVGTDGKLMLKFNRYGHGMDPERGMLLFLNKNYNQKPIVKFLVQRENRNKYKSLYEGNNQDAIMEIIDAKVIPNDNIVTFDIAYDLFKKATNTHNLFQSALITGNTIIINDNDLMNCLNSSLSVINNLLHFGEKIILCDLNDNVIVEIKWNLELVDNYYLTERQKSLMTSKIKMPTKLLPNDMINEDVVTFASMSVFLMNNMKNIAVSYPGAQGDRKILQGTGLTTKRNYIDIISVHKCSDDEYDVFLQENKKKIYETQRSDIDKLVSVRNDSEKMAELNQLIEKVYTPIVIKECYIGVGGQESPMAPGETRFDYLMYIMINGTGNIVWKILSSNPIIFEIFDNIKSSSGSLEGEITLNSPMYIVY